MSKVIDFLKSNIKVIIVFILILCFVIFFFSRNSLKKKTTYTVVDGTIEQSDETNLYVLKNETLVDYDSTQPVTAIVDQGKRTAKGEAIATYKSENYDDNQSKIDDIDKQIQTLVKDLPPTYSADISNIDNEILKYSTQIQNETSYTKMQEYKAKLDELAYKKITVIANTTPDSSAIRDLVNQREELVNIGKQSSNNIWSPVSGLVTYKIDGLENSYEYNNIPSYDIQDFENIISKYDGTINSEFGIKIVDNYNIYFLVKTKRGDNDQYIKQGTNYTIRIADLENKNIRATLIKNIQNEECNYSLFEIDNEIDNVIDYRKLSCEIVWNTFSGMAVPMNAIYNNEEKGYSYVLMVYGADYVEVPVKILQSSDSIAIVENLTQEELNSIGYTKGFVLELYDELVIQERSN